MHGFYIAKTTPPKRLFSLRRLSKTLPHYRTSSWTITLGNCTHILARGIAKGTLVGRGHILSRGKDSEVQSDEE